MSKIKNSVEEISEKQFDDKIKSGVVVIDFFAEWCMPCVMMGPVIEELSEKFKGKIEFAKLNIDDNPSAAEKLGVMSIPTLVTFKEGKEVDRVSGVISAEQLKEKLKTFI